MHLTVIGTVINDFIRFTDGSTQASLGGILHTVNALRAALDPDDRIRPVSYVGSDIYDAVIHNLNQDSRVDTRGLMPLDAPNNRVELIYCEAERRTEISLNPLPSLQFDQIRPHLDADALVVNMISGWDIGLSDMQQIRHAFSRLIYFDLHSLALGRHNDGRRYYRTVEDFDEWIKCCDILQLNEQEFNTINEESIPAEFLFESYCREQEKIINLTRGSQGSTSYFNRGNNMMHVDTFPPSEIPVVDPTGCGDAFMAGFLNNYLRGGSVNRASREANILAAVTGSFRGLAEPHHVRNRFKDFIEDNR